MRYAAARRKPMKSLVSSSLFAALVGASLFVSGCAKEYVRGSQDPSIDNAAMSTGLDKDDIQRMLQENLNKLRNAPIMDMWRQDRGQDTVAIFPYQNATSEHIDSVLAAALSETETWLVESGVVTVISRERQKQMIAEVEGQQNPVFNPANVTKYGRQLGAKYFITGKVQAADERTDDARRVQYFLFMQVVEVETGVIRFQHKSYVTKMVR
jgi:PBP1b-binding outer membrane lipoprotein LpoB